MNVLLGAFNYALEGPAWALVRREVDRRMERGLHAAGYEVRMEASWLDLLRRHVPEVSIRAHDVVLKDGPMVARVHVKIEGLTVERDVITRLDRLFFSGTATERDLNAFLPNSPKKPSFLAGMALDLQPGRVEMSGRIMRGYIPIPFTTAGRLEISSGNPAEIDFVFEKLSIVIVRIPTFSQTIPVLDLADHPLGIHLRSVRVRTATLEVTGTARPKLPLPLKDLKDAKQPRSESSQQGGVP